MRQLNNHTFPPACMLCAEAKTTQLSYDNRRHFFSCPECHLVFVPPWEYLSNAQEKAHYLNHRNQAEDDGYRRFLARLFNPVNQQLKKRSAGLDFGCGPGPTLHLMFEDAGHKMAIYDSFFFPDKAVLEAQYDFITASEVVEHLHHPREVIEELWRCLRPGGMLAIMTQFVPAGTPFEKWYYKNDETHVCFFSPETFMYLETQLQARLTLHRNVAIYTRIKASIPKESI